MKYPVEPDCKQAELYIDGDPLQDYKIDTISEEDKAIEFVRFNQAMEGFEMTPEDEAECRKIFRGEITVEESIKEILKNHGIEEQ